MPPAGVSRLRIRGLADLEAAREAFARTLELDPGHVSARRNLEQGERVTGES